VMSPLKAVASVQQKAEINKVRKTENGTSLKLKRGGTGVSQGLPKSCDR
jgi:hypothetical protein